MRTLRFIVDKQNIRPDPNCDFSGLVPGTEQYLLAEFSFSPEWKDTVKVAAFWSILGREYEPQVLKDGKSCVIPSEALKKSAFKVQILGRKDETRMVTDKVTVKQTGGRV